MKNKIIIPLGNSRKMMAVVVATVWKAVVLVMMMLMMVMLNDMTNDEDGDEDADEDDDTDDKNEMTVKREPKPVHGDHKQILGRMGVCRPHQHRVDVIWMTEGGRWAALDVERMALEKAEKQKTWE